MRILLFLAGRHSSEVLWFNFADFLQAKLCFQGNQNTVWSDPESHPVLSDDGGALWGIAWM